MKKLLTLLTIALLASCHEPMVIERQSRAEYRNRIINDNLVKHLGEKEMKLSQYDYKLLYNVVKSEDLLKERIGLEAQISADRNSLILSLIENQKHLLQEVERLSKLHEQDTIIPPPEPEEVKAFPTAYGAGAYVTGGRGKPVYKVTNLNDSGPGSLRQILNDTRTTDGGQIVYTVSGVINLKSPLFAAGIRNVTISGQTAPEGGITIGNYPMGFYSLSSNTIPSANIIIRYVRFRPDSFSALPIQMDVLDMQYVQGYIIDHCSLSFGTDESAHHGWYENFTWQNNLIAENSKGMIMGQVDRGEGNFSFNRNVIYNNSHRFPNIQSGGRVDLINNLVWSFHSRMSRSRGNYSLNQIGNYYVCDPFDDPANPDRRWNHIQSGTYGYPNGIYTNGNYFFDGNNTVLDGNSANDDYNSLWFDGVSSTPLPSQFEVSAPYEQLGAPFAIETAQQVKANLPDNCGATKRLGEDGSVIAEVDVLDAMYIDNIKNDVHTGWVYTGDQTSGAINDNNSSPHYNAFQATVTGTPINTHPVGYDTDGDGMPDAWEIATFGDLTKTASDDEDGDGYTNIEEYLNKVDD